MKTQRPKTASKGFRSSFDHFGSYTGNVIDNDETKPVQDADDL